LRHVSSSSSPGKPPLAGWDAGDGCCHCEHLPHAEDSRSERKPRAHANPAQNPSSLTRSESCALLVSSPTVSFLATHTHIHTHPGQLTLARNRSWTEDALPKASCWLKCSDEPLTPWPFLPYSFLVVLPLRLCFRCNLHRGPGGTFSRWGKGKPSKKDPNPNPNPKDLDSVTPEVKIKSFLIVQHVCLSPDSNFLGIGCLRHSNSGTSPREPSLGADM
jgi:hypothetical protein